MATIKNGSYRVFNGTDFDTINFTTTAANVSIADSGGLIIATNVEGALAEQAGKINTLNNTATTSQNGLMSSTDKATLDGSTNLNTASKLVKRDPSGNFSAGTITATLSGNASTATKLSTARTISLTGEVTGSASFDGSANVSMTTTAVKVNGHAHYVQATEPVSPLEDDIWYDTTTFTIKVRKGSTWRGFAGVYEA